MTGPTCQQVREDAAVALLRGEPMPDDVRLHRNACWDCREELTRLAALGPLLEVSRDTETPAAEVPDDRMLGRLLGEMARRRARRRRLLVAAVAAAVVVVAVPVGIVASGDRPSPGAAQQGDVLVAEGTAEAPGTDIGADVHVLARGEGRGSTLVVAPWGLQGGVRCRIVLVDSEGVDRPVMTWTVPQGYTKGWRSRAEVSVAPREVASVRLVNADTGSTILSVPVEQV